MQSRKADIEETEWLGYLEQLSCLVCELYHQEPESPAETHHLDGRCKPKAHLETIRLCPRHHRLKDNKEEKRWVSLHGDGKFRFQNRYTFIGDLLKIQKERVESLKERIG